MRHARRWIDVILTVASLFTVSGCGGAGSIPSVDSSKTEAKVTGTVKVHGQPMKGGTISFDPTTGGRTDVSAKTVPVKDDGTFEVTTFLGHNAVRIAGPAVTKEPTLGYATKVIEVTSGDNKVDLDFPPK
jgi:hypothetical protein